MGRHHRDVVDDTAHTPPAIAIDGFDVLERIGDGGFSVVYRARQHSMNREAAVKVLDLRFANEAERRTFEHECHALGQLSNHPNIVTVFSETLTSDGRPCIVMELYSTTYRERLDAMGPLPIEEVLSLGVRICGALQTAHDAGVLHRDLKPHNIFVSAYGEPALADFGISTIDDERSQRSPSGLSVSYAAPEVLEDGATDARSDLYSLAATLYQLASGIAPFASPDLKTTVRRILTEPVAPIDRSDMPAGFDRVMRRALAKDPADRPASANELAEMLREVQARAGLGRTPIPHTTITVDARREAPGSAGDDSPAGGRLPPPVLPVHPAAESEASRGLTIARARQRQRQPQAEAVDADRHDNRQRMIASAGAVVAALVLLVPGIRLFSGDDGQAAPAPSTSTETPVTTTTPPTTAEPPTTTPSSTAPPPELTDVVVPGTVWWTDSGVDVSAGDVVQVEATGIVSASVTDPRTYVGPDGSLKPEFTDANRDEHGVKVGGGHAALIGMIDDGPPFLIGASNTLHVETGGRLFLSVNDGGLNNNSGQFDVSLTVARHQ